MRHLSRVPFQGISRILPRLTLCTPALQRSYCLVNSHPPCSAVPSMQQPAAAAQSSAVSLAPGVQVLDGGAVTDNRSTKISICGFEVEGVSIAGQETCIILPRFKVCFDVGRCPQRAVFQQTVLISHGHLDHVGGLPFHISSRCLLNVAPSKVIVPPCLFEGVTAYIDASKVMQGNPTTDYDLIPLEPGQDYQLPSGFIARPFATTHSIPSQGYLVYSSRKKLKTELQGKSQDDIRELRLSGVDVTDTFQVPEVCFTGDTTSEFFDTAPEDVFKARLLIIECSFIDDDVSMEQAAGKGHMHVGHLATNAHRFQNEAILLIHFSSRYTRAQIVESLNLYLPPSLRAKCVPFLNGFAG